MGFELSNHSSTRNSQLATRNLNQIMQKILFTFVLISAMTTMYAQELRVDVTVNTPKNQTADPQLYSTLELGLEEFMNNTKWTDDTYQENERIEVNMQINITEEVSATQFNAELFIQAIRPVYGSRQNTALLEHADKEFSFAYTQFQPLEFNRNTFTSNLTSFMAFYAYMIIGLDYDSFELEGGTPYFQIAQEVVNAVPNGAAKGWSSLDGQRNRYWMIESTLSPRAGDYRSAIYEYHRMGLDLMASQPDVARQNISGAIQKISAFSKSYLNAMSIQMFTNAKRDEIVDIYTGAPTNEKRPIHSVMVRIDPANASKYTKIRR